LGHEKIEMAEEAARFLGRIGGKEVIEFLTDCLENHSGRLIGAVAEALGQAGAVQAIPKLDQLLDEYKDEEDADDLPWVSLGGWINGYVRARVAGALCQMGEERGRIALIEIFTEGHSQNKKHAAKALAQCRPDEVKTLLPEVISKIPRTYDSAKYDLVALADVLYELDACDDPVSLQQWSTFLIALVVMRKIL
jgi:HEAT repeat protein